MPNILLCFTNNISLENWNNSGSLSRELIYIEKFLKNNYTFSLLTYGNSKDEEIELASYINIIPIYKVIKRLSNKYLNNFFHLIRILKVSFILKEVDIIKSNQLLGSNIAILIGLLFNKKVIVRIGYEPNLNITYDKFLPVQSRNKSINKFFIMKFYFLGLFSYKLCDHIICTTKVQKNFIKKNFLIKNSKISVIPNWIDTDLFSPGNNDFIKKGILYVGRLEPEKNPEFLLNSMNGIKEKITFIGAGSLKNKLLKIAKDNAIDIEMIDPVPNENLVSFYRNCKLFIQSSYYEGNPKTILEAMSCGCAVIAKNVAGIKELINKKNGVLIDSESDLNRVIKDLLENKIRRQELGKNARRDIKHNNDINLCLEKEKQILFKLKN